MTLDNIVSDDTIQNVEETTEEEGGFLVVSYDLPSEKSTYSSLDSDAQADLEKSLKSKRQSLQRSFKRLGVKLSDSTYIAHASHVSSLISMVQNTYASLDDIVQDLVRDQVQLDVVGRSYPHVIQELLEDTLEQETDDIASDLGEIEDMIDSGECSADSVRNRLYRMSRRLDVLVHRVEDLERLSEEQAGHYRNIVLSLQDRREDLLDREELDASSP